MKQVRYTHIFNFSSFGFVSEVVDLVLNHLPAEISEEQLFVVRCEELYQKLKNRFPACKQLVLDLTPGSIVNVYAKSTDYLFLHGFCSLYEIFQIRSCYLNKIVWRTWGSDAGVSFRRGEPVKNFAKRLFQLFRKPRIRKLAAIGCGSKLDIVDIEERYGTVNTMYLPYCRNARDSIDLVQETKKDETLRILIGHSGFSNDNHIEATKIFDRFIDRNVHFYYIFSYGDRKYIEKVKGEIQKITGDKATFIEEHMPYLDYVKFLEKMDLMVLLGEKSYALGNISIFCSFGKWLLLNRNGVLKQGMDQYQIPYLTKERIQNMEFDDLIGLVRKKNQQAEILAPINSEQSCLLWTEVFQFLNELCY